MMAWKFTTLPLWRTGSPFSNCKPVSATNRSQWHDHKNLLWCFTSPKRRLQCQPKPLQTQQLTAIWTLEDNKSINLQRHVQWRKLAAVLFVTLTDEWHVSLLSLWTSFTFISLILLSYPLYLCCQLSLFPSLATSLTRILHLTLMNSSWYI